MPGKRHIHLDFETYCDVDLLKSGADAYARHVSCEALMLAWAPDGTSSVDDVMQWVPAEGEDMPEELEDILHDPDTILEAWNASFERAIMKHVLGIDTPPERWRDTMIRSAYCAFPLTLKGASEAIGLGADKAKMSAGTRLIRKFCMPRKPTKNKPWTRETKDTDPDDWELFKLYNRMDVVAECAIANKLRRFEPTEQVWREWHTDRAINERGMPVNMHRVENAIRIYEEEVSAAIDEMKRLTGLSNPNSQKQLLSWLQENGYPFGDVAKGHVKMAIERFRDMLDKADVGRIDRRHTMKMIRVLELRLRASLSSPKKFYALKSATSEDGYLRNVLQFYGASRTGRFAGRVFQPQNLPRPHWEFEEPELQQEIAEYVEHLDGDCIRAVLGDPLTILKSSIRQCVQAPEGKMFASADYSAIENRGIGWICGDEKILDVFRKGRDPYMDFATYLYNRPYDEIYHEVKVLKRKEKRTLAKPAVLGCGYMLGPGKKSVNKRTGEVEAYGLLGYALDMGIDMTEEQAEKSVKTFRDTFVDVKSFWYASADVVKRVIRTGRAESIGPLEFDMKGPFLRMRLPSGRYLHYFRPKVEMKETPWGEMRPTVTYMGTDSKTKKWKRLKTHPGKILENATQAVCRDLLTYAIERCREENLDVRLHVHDEIVVMDDEDVIEERFRTLKDIMSEAPSWAKGFPMAAAGGIYKMFVKD